MRNYLSRPGFGGGRARPGAAHMPTTALRFGHRSGGADPEPPGLVAGRRSDAAVGSTAYDDRSATQAGIVSLFDRRIEGVHIDMQNTPIRREHQLTGHD